MKFTSLLLMVAGSALALPTPQTEPAPAEAALADDATPDVEGNVAALDKRQFAYPGVYPGVYPVGYPGVYPGYGPYPAYGGYYSGYIPRRGADTAK